MTNEELIDEPLFDISENHLVKASDFINGRKQDDYTIKTKMLYQALKKHGLELKENKNSAFLETKIRFYENKGKEISYQIVIVPNDGNYGNVTCYLSSQGSIKELLIPCEGNMDILRECEKIIRALFYLTF